MAVGPVISTGTQLVGIGSNILTVQAAGTQPLSYQWYQGAAGDTSVPVGAGGDTFPTVPLAGTASFWVRVSNACGHADSEAATVTVARTLGPRLRPAA